MGPSRAYRIARARLHRAGKAFAGTYKVLSVSQYMRRRASGEHFWTVTSRVFLIIIVYLLLCCTAIDVLRQSFQSGQFWNAIIVIVCVTFIAFWVLLLNLVRRVEVNRWLNAIPRQHQLGMADVGSKMIERITASRQWCMHLFNTQVDFAAIEHPGLQNPLQKRSTTGMDSSVETPYWEFMDTISIYLEDNFGVVVPELTMPKQTTIRDYIERAIAEKVLDTTHIVPHIQRFLELYEKMRYSGTSLVYTELIAMMDALVRIVEEIQRPEAGMQASTRSQTSSLPNAYPMVTYPGNNTTPGHGRGLSHGTSGSAQHAPFPYSYFSDTDGSEPVRPTWTYPQPAFIPRRRQNSRTSEGSTDSMESVRIYPTRDSVVSARTYDSQQSAFSQASIVSPFARLRRPHTPHT